jgi:hypothetical protein
MELLILVEMVQEGKVERFLESHMLVVEVVVATMLMDQILLVLEELVVEEMVEQKEFGEQMELMV